MNPQQQTFVTEMLRHGDKLAAYRTAYPGDKSGKTIESAVNRLLKHPEVKQAIDEPTNRIRAEAEAGLKERMQDELLNLCEMQKILTQIIRGQLASEKQVRIKDHFETIQVKPTISNILTAINTLLRMAKAPSPKEKAPSGFPQEGGKETSVLSSPPWGELEGAPHPFGNIYPPTYPGPYYDPADPNTKDKLQNLQNSLRHFDSEGLRKEKSPEALQSAPSAQASNISTSREISPGVRNDGQLSTTCNNETLSLLKVEIPHENTTIHNKLPCHTIPAPVIASGSEAISRKQEEVLITRDCFVAGPPRNDDTQQQNTTIHNNPDSGAAICPPELRDNLTLCKNWKQLSASAQQALLHGALHKQGWQTIEEAFNEVYNTYLRNQHSGTRHMLKQFEKVKAARNDPPTIRGPIEKEMGWAWHPQYPGMVKRTGML